LRASSSSLRFLKSLLELEVMVLWEKGSASERLHWHSAREAQTA
jgi:hypothetical protein